MPAENVSTPAPRRVGRQPTKAVLGALSRYRIAAFAVGVGLLILCLTIVLQIAGYPKPVEIWGTIHGVLYVIYVLLSFDLAYKNRWSLLGILKVLVAGVIPVLSFVMERSVHRKVLAGEKI